MTMNNAAALYFKDEFNQSTESAAAIASIFGWMNLFARGMGGYFSDRANARLGMRGRLWVQTILLACEGSLILVFANTGTLAGAIVVMIFFSLFVQAAEGSSYGIVPYIDPPCTGSISGIVGAGGNVGAVGFGLAFRQLPYREAFAIMGCTIIASSFTSIFVHIKGHSGLLCGKESPEEQYRARPQSAGPQKGAAEMDCVTEAPEDSLLSSEDADSQSQSKTNESIETDPESEQSDGVIEV
uniref:Nitrate/nitrite transporter n=1 Tax=Craspedostauros australis TaxID=1486917 RepID=A0A7R9WUC5_9STRA